VIHIGAICVREARIGDYQALQIVGDLAAAEVDQAVGRMPPNGTICIE
jgi:hypothetical protein